MRRFCFVVAAGLAGIWLCAGLRAQTPAGSTFEVTIAPGANYDKANFRLWVPDGVGTVRAVAVLVPGSNGDGRGEVSDAAWQAFAVKHKLALVGCQITDKPHDQGFIEDYVNMPKGTGDAFLDALGKLTAQSKHPEVASAPLFLWGMSAGGQFNYEFNAWKPERVAAFVVNKGGIYYTALASKSAREVPGILFVGGKDLEFRTNTITGLFAVNRRGGALWALAEEPSVAHIVGRSKELTMMFFEDVMPLRLVDGASGVTLKAMDPKSGFIGDFKTKTFKRIADAGAITVPTAWLPTERVAHAWMAMVTETPFEK
jgi:poly(3-hydroxybutyrate) depolymerase